MTITVTGKNDLPTVGGIGPSALLSKLEKDGRLPPVSLLLRPLQPSNAAGVLASAVGASSIASAVSATRLVDFLTYRFQSSILVPVDTFDFTWAAPDSPPLNDRIREGDIAVLTCNDVPICTGIIDTTEVETDAAFGEKTTLTGRDLMSQFEDNDAISLDSKPIWAEKVTVRNGVQSLMANTRITTLELRNAPSAAYLLATEPGESKLAALQRFLEPLNCLAWMGPDGTLVVGKPTFAQAPSGRLVLSRDKRQSNVLSMRVSRASTQIPGVIVPVWAGQETTVDRAPVQQRLYNAASGPSRLFKLGHRVAKSVVVSAPNATDPQGLSDINAIATGGANLLQSYAKRELARLNIGEMMVQAVVPGHVNDSGQPYVTDTCYFVEYDRGSVAELMYLYQVEYELTLEQGQRTNLWFCRLGCIVSDVLAP